jgi:hypothetical protein
MTTPGETIFHPIEKSTADHSEYREAARAFASLKNNRPPDRRLFAAAHESAYGTKRTSRQRSGMSAFGGKADITI